MCEKQEESGWREMSGIVGVIESPAESRSHVTNVAVGQGANGGRSPLWNILFQLFLCHMSKEVT
jgi:hypothetical protein